MRESISVISWCSFVSALFLILTYGVTVNAEAHFFTLDSVWISNNFLITLFGGVFASMLVVLLCEIQKYLSSKKRTEQYLFYQSLYLYQALVQTRIFIEDFLNHGEWILSDNLFDESNRKIQCQLDAIQTTDYATFKHDKDSLMVEHGRFCIDVLPKIQPILQSGNRLRISINNAKIEYLQSESAFEEGILQLYRTGKIVRFLEETEAHAKRADQSISIERAVLIIRVLSRNWGKFEVDDRGMLGIPFNWRFQNCVNPLLKGMDLTSRLDCINAVFHDEEVQPSTLVLLLSDFEKQHGRFTESKLQEGDALVPPDTLYELEKVFKNRAVDAIESGKVFNQYQGLNFLWLLGLIDSALVATIKKTIIKSDSILTIVINYCASRGTAVTNTFIKTRYVNFERVNEFIDVDEAYRRICDYIKTEEFLFLA